MCALNTLSEASWRKTRDENLDQRRANAALCHSYATAAAADLQQWQHRTGHRKRSNWEDCMVDMYGLEWRQQVRDAPSWRKKEDAFVYGYLELKDLGGYTLKRAEKGTPWPYKRKRTRRRGLGLCV